MKKILGFMFGLYGRTGAAVLTVCIMCAVLDIPWSYVYMTAFFAFLGFVGTIVYAQTLQGFLLTWKTGYLVIGGGTVIFITYLCVKVIVIAVAIEPSIISPHPERVIADWGTLLSGVWYNVLAVAYYKWTEVLVPPNPNGRTLGY